MANQDLKSKLDKIRRIFDVDTILRQNIDNRVIVNYYTDSHFGYKIFHSTAGSLHMSLNFDGNFDKEGYYAQETVRKVIRVTLQARIWPKSEYEMDQKELFGGP